MIVQIWRLFYYYVVFEGVVDDFMWRFKQVFKGEIGFWMFKFSMNKFLGSLFSKFNIFVLGDEGDGIGNGGEGEIGYFVCIVIMLNISCFLLVFNFEMYGSLFGLVFGLMFLLVMGVVVFKYVFMVVFMMLISFYEFLLYVFV